MGGEWTINSEEKKKFFLKHFEEQWEKHKHLTVKIRTGKQRTSTQNAAMHKYFEMLAEALNDAGYTVQAFHSKPIEMDWTPALIKDLIWRKIQLAMFPDKESTTKLNRDEVSQIYDQINKVMIDKRINVEFPHNKVD